MIIKLWLLEINHKPCFPKGEVHPLKNPCLISFWKIFFMSILFQLLMGFNKTKSTIVLEAARQLQHGFLFRKHQEF